MRRESLIVAVAAGLVLGVATRYVYELPREWHWLAKVGVPWLAAAFAIGALARDPRRGAVNGAAALVAAVFIYYLPAMLDGRTSYPGSPVGLGWTVIGLPGGALFGALGGLYARGRARVIAASVLAGSFAGEAILFALVVSHPGRAGTYMLAVAMALPFLLLHRARDRVAALAATALLAGAAVIAEGSVFVLARYV